MARAASDGLMFAGTLILAMLLDAALGEPRWLWSRVPHPAVVMGRLFAWAERRFNTGTARRAKGTVLMVALVCAAWVIGAGLAALPGHWAEVICAAVLLAQRSLVDHVSAVARALGLSLGDGRLAVSNIVSRDTRDMEASAVSRSAIESAAENLSDGVIAPAFWFLIGGLPGLLIYKITNTGDSMIGYLNPRYAAFGWAAARFDDLLNLIPARLTAALIWVLTHPRPLWRDIAQDARRHRSPNAGWPEAAMARALHVSLAGPRSYDGQIKDFAYVHDLGRRNVTRSDVDAAVRMLWKSWALVLLCLLPLWLL